MAVLIQGLMQIWLAIELGHTSATDAVAHKVIRAFASAQVADFLGAIRYGSTAHLSF